MISAKLAVGGVILGILVLLWWYSSLSERLAQIEQTLSAMQAEQQQWQTALAREQPLAAMRTRFDLLESRLLSVIGEITEQVTSGIDRLTTQLTSLESRMDVLRDQLGIVESLIEGGALEQTVHETAATGRQP